MEFRSKETRWTARTENTLGALLCRLAEGGVTPGTCGAHIGEAVIILNHLADLGVLNTPPGGTT